MNPPGVRFLAQSGVFQKAGYVTYPGMFEDKRADNLSFRFQNQRLLSCKYGWVPFTFELVPVSVPEIRYRYPTVPFFGTLLSV